MPVTQLTVCNSALIKIGSDRISSITQDTRAAVLLNAIWSQTLDSVLRAHPWNFAITRAELAPTSDEPAFEWDYEYDLPSDCLRVLDLMDGNDEDIEFVIEDQKILTNESTIYARYIYRNDDPSSWDACFAEALAWRLAKEVVMSLSGNAALVEVCDKAYMKQLAEARTMDGAEGIIKGLESNTWTNARR